MIFLEDKSSIIDFRLLLSIGIPAVIAVVGWLVGHRLNARRELLNRRREARLKGLEIAYNRLAMVALRDWTDERKLEFEKFVAEIQLYGTPRQIALMQEIVNGMTKPETEVSFDSLLKDLRDTLRSELRMEAVEGGVWWYRFALPEWKNKSKQ